MGAEPWTTWVAGVFNREEALAKARAQVFANGEHALADENPSSIEEAVELGEASGTASILDIDGFSEQDELGKTRPLSEEDLEYYFETLQPTLEQVDECMEVWEDLDRGCSRYLTFYEDGRPAGIVFIGYSFD